MPSLRRLVPAAGLALALGLSAAMPADAAAVEWKDAEGDATALFVLDSTPLPSEDGLDITKVKLDFDGKNLLYVVSLKKVGDGPPSLATGHYFRLHWTYGDVAFHFRVSDDQGNGKTTTMIADDDTTQATLSCSGCIGLLDRKTSTLTLKAPIAALSRAMRESEATLKPIAPGSKFTGLFVDAQRSIGTPAGTLTPQADSATAPETLSFTF